MKIRTILRGAIISFAPLVFGNVAHAETTLLSDVTLNNPCATFYQSVTGTDGATYNKLTYGETINFPTIDGSVQPEFDAGNDGTFTLNFQVNGHGAGTGATSGIKYQFNGKARFLAKANLLNQDTTFTGRFKLDARLIGQGRAASAAYPVAQGAQDNAVLHMYVNIVYSSGAATLSVTKADLSLECSASPWHNLMTNEDSTTKKSQVGRGFGDVWNKYAWSMRDFNGGLLVGTKNAYYNFGIVEALASDNTVPCNDPNNPLGQFLEQVPAIYRYLACAELLAGSSDGVSKNVGTNTRFAEIWRFDYAKKNWTKVNEQTPATTGDYAGEAGQGFRKMLTHNGKVYAGSDWGSFIMGVQLGTGPTQSNPGGKWKLPGSRVLSSIDGLTWTPIASCTATAAGTPCHAPFATGDGSLSPVTQTNISFRAMASYKPSPDKPQKLYIGTWNWTGGEVWSFDESKAGAAQWEAIAKFVDPSASSLNPALKTIVEQICNTPGSTWYNKCVTGSGVYSTAALELEVYNGKLIIGLAAPAGNKYLWQYDGTSTTQVLAPDVNNTTYGVIKLFVTSNNQLYVGFVDLQVGFTLLRYDGPAAWDATKWTTITNTGFGNAQNAYPWSMNELGGRVFVGTFNQEFFSQAPRGSSELWYSDDQKNWTQYALPASWGLWNYGIRNLTVGNKGSQLFLGSASNMIAPDVLYPQNGAVVWPDGSTVLSPGAEVWSIRATTATK